MVWGWGCVMMGVLFIRVEEFVGGTCFGGLGGDKGVDSVH